MLRNNRFQNEIHRQNIEERAKPPDRIF